MKNLPVKSGVLHKSWLWWWLGCEKLDWRKHGSTARLGKALLASDFLVTHMKGDK